MDIYSYLKKDHRIITKLLEEILAATEGVQRADLFETLKAEILVHNATKEATFYTALGQHDEAVTAVAKAEEGSQEVERYLRKLTTTPVAHEAWMVLFGEFKHCVTHHIKEEEDDLFTLANKLLDEEDANGLAEDMAALKQDPRIHNKTAHTMRWMH